MSYNATAVASAVIGNVMDFWPKGCRLPSTIHCEKVYPVGFVAGAARFTLAVPYGMLETV